MVLWIWEDVEEPLAVWDLAGVLTLGNPTQRSVGGVRRPPARRWCPSIGTTMVTQKCGRCK